MSNNISIKGTRDGLTITLGQGDLDQLLEELSQHLATQGAFFRGGRVALQVGDRAMSAEDLARLDMVLNEQDMSLRSVLAFSPATVNAAEGLGLSASAMQTSTAQTPAAPEPPMPATPLSASGASRPEAAASTTQATEESRDAAAATRLRPSPPVQPVGRPTEDSKGVLLRRIVRSGQVVRHPGHIVVLGDVNAGGEVIAGGDVVVWGRLRGVVHAGAGGDPSAVVCALDLSPMQLRIGATVARSGDDDKARKAQPEVASLRDEAIVVEPWDQRHKGL
ncbi:MAG: septum site-determining protein MinC [Anaerolineae bacterium]